jgi:hypothetical protein
MARNTKLPIIITPTGHAAYAWLAKKDTKFNADGVYKVTIVLDKQDIDEGRLDYGKSVVSGKDWLKHITDTCKEHGVASKPGERGCPIKDGDKSGKEEFAGKWLIGFKSSYKPACIDTKGNALPASLPVYSGDVIKVAAQPVAGKMANGDGYLSLYLSKVMLVEKLTSAGGDAAMFGEVAGYEVSEADAAGADDADFGVTHEEEDGDF